MQLSAPEERLPPPVEAAIYYVVSEALANVAKYAQASHVTVEVARADGRAVVAIADDGIGGADPSGSGLRGLATASRRSTAASTSTARRRAGHESTPRSRARRPFARGRRGSVVARDYALHLGEGRRPGSRGPSCSAAPPW